MSTPSTRCPACASGIAPRPVPQASINTSSRLRASFDKIGLKNALVIAGPEVDANFKLAARNIPNVDVLPNAGLNVYDVLRRHTLVLTPAAIEAINARFEEAA